MIFRVDIKKSEKDKVITDLKSKFPEVEIKIINSNTLVLTKPPAMNVSEVRGIIDETPGINRSDWMAY